MVNETVDYTQTLFLPRTSFPMRGNLIEKEPELVEFWKRIDLYKSIANGGKAKPLFVLHDGPPYANGHIHIGTALNKILKDILVKYKRLQGHPVSFIPGWDCHGLPIEWKVEELLIEGKQSKNALTVNAFRDLCRDFARQWVDVQKQEFIRLGVIADWDHPYITMDYAYEALIAEELLKFFKSGQLYLGSKPVLWSVVEGTALAEAEIEYEPVSCEACYVLFSFRLVKSEDLKSAKIVIWTTTPWTIPANRAVAYSRNITYCLVKASLRKSIGKASFLVVARACLTQLIERVPELEVEIVRDLRCEELEGCTVEHPLKAMDSRYGFDVPLLHGHHVSETAGTGFVHTAPSHGQDDYELWISNDKGLKELHIDTRIPKCVNEEGHFTEEAFGFTGESVLSSSGEWGSASRSVIEKLKIFGSLLGTHEYTHSYPCSWRSRKPVIYISLPQWFIAMDRPIECLGQKTLRRVALDALSTSDWIPSRARNRIQSMVESRPDWVVSRQRLWGVPITLFVHKTTNEVLNDPEVDKRIIQSFYERGANAWFQEGAIEFYLGEKYNPGEYTKVDDILDVWFDSGCTHNYILKKRLGLDPSATTKEEDVLYFEGSDQHRGWFQASLLESCGTNAFAPYSEVFTHGYVLDDKGYKMSKSRGNVVSPQELFKTIGADILRLWAASTDCTSDVQIGTTVLKTIQDMYRKIRNTLRWMLGMLSHHNPESSVPIDEFPSLERYVLIRLKALEDEISEAIVAYDFKRVVALINGFIVNVLSSFYFEVRKDVLYCDPISSTRRKASLECLHLIFERLTVWLSPILAFTCEEAWQHRYSLTDRSVHMHQLSHINYPAESEDFTNLWNVLMRFRSEVLNILEKARNEKRIGSNLESCVKVFCTSQRLVHIFSQVDLSELLVVSQVELTYCDAIDGDQSFIRIESVDDTFVNVDRAQGKKCSRCWKITQDVGSDLDYPDVTLRDAQALREYHSNFQSG